MFDANQISDNQFSFELLRSNGHSVLLLPSHIQIYQVEKRPESYDRGMTFQVPLDD